MVPRRWAERMAEGIKQPLALESLRVRSWRSWRWLVGRAFAWRKPWSEKRGASV